MAGVKIGVLALQGAFAKHKEKLHAVGADPVEVRTAKELEGCSGLIIPGGESTTIYRHLQRSELGDKLKAFAAEHPLFGTCAGLILISQKITGDTMEPLHLLDVTVERNAYGRQADSFKASLEVTLEKQKKAIEGFFIRAPRIAECGPGVEILARLGDDPVLVRQGFHLGATFHPELTPDTTIHAYFTSLCKRRP